MYASNKVMKDGIRKHEGWHMGIWAIKNGRADVPCNNVVEYPHSKNG